MTDYIVKTYIVYLPVALLITFGVARIFFKNSKIFMLDIFSGREEIASSTNKLFETGFYLLSLGFALFRMKVDQSLFTRYNTVMENGLEVRNRVINFGQQEMFEMLSSKVGVLAVVLGMMVFFLMFMLFRGKKKSSEGRQRREQMQEV